MNEHEKLKSELYYDEESGLFVWIKETYMFGKYAGAKNKDGYIRIKFNGKLILSHRLAWFYVYGDWPKQHIDHINRIRDDNRIENLRDVSIGENNLNTVRKPNKTGHIGVYRTRHGKYMAVYYIKRRSKYIGTYNKIEDAILARKSVINNNQYGE